MALKGENDDALAARDCPQRKGEGAVETIPTSEEGDYLRS